ncbi:hypothetical protein EJD97_002730 [Solanum chilense]|uniref:SEC1 family transport protein SLY1 n=1 Tax=Solanum chilense TaxID=4083 RepID=A0A6N2BXI7_SOLCI|nr:hypothetical protein EJD97_002730 [Solanum chilense]
MALNLRQKHTECITRMLNLNQPVNAGGTANEEVYKILIYDRFCQDILSPLIHVKDLRKHGVTLYFHIDKDRTIYSESIERIVKVHDQYLEFVTLEDNLFSLAYKNYYLHVLVTLAVVPVIRCPRGGPAEMVASLLDQRLRDHLLAKNNLFSEGANFTSSFQRPVLCLFDRNFKLSVAIQYDFRYRPLVHDVLGLRLNRLNVQEDKGGIKSYELDRSDPFWMANWSLQFPEVALEIESQLGKYKKDIEEVNKRIGGSGGTEFDETDLVGNTKHMMNAVNSLPELTERKQVIDKHTNIATSLLGEIKETSLDSYAKKESDMLVRGGIDHNELLGVLKGKMSKADKLRFAIIYLISTKNMPQSEVEMIEAALRESEVDTSAFQYVKKIKSLNVSFASANSASTSNIVDWAEKLYGQSISAVTAGGGNYVEYGSLQEFAHCQQPVKHIIYGTTEILTGGEFIEQLGVLGQKMGLESTIAVPNH